jgi:hypothetical protein
VFLLINVSRYYYKEEEEEEKEEEEECMSHTSWNTAVTASLRKCDV